jgi:hypothetical protein
MWFERVPFEPLRLLLEAQLALRAKPVVTPDLLRRPGLVLRVTRRNSLKDLVARP